MKQSILLITALITFSCSIAGEKEPLRLLVFSKTMGYRHESISSGIKMLYDQSREQAWIITATEDAGLLQDDILRNIDVAVFLNPSGDALDTEQQAALERFIRSGKGFVGIHSSADFEYDWPWYGNLNGAHFSMHPPAQVATVILEDTSHPAMKPFKGMKSFTVLDEWYSFRTNPRDRVNVLATLDESTILKSNNDDWKMGYHPIVWWQEYEGSRSFYTGFGHAHESFANPVIREHITEAINWAGYRDK